MKIYLVENMGNSPGKIMACFANKLDAEMFCALLQTGDAHQVVERTLFYGQPDRLGYNE